MSAHNAEFCRAWLRKAEHDLITARRVLDMPEGPTDTPCFHAQQAIEKALKGLLTRHGIEVGRTHDLLILLERARPLLPDLAQYEEACALLTAYGVDVRYPGDSPDPERAEALTAERIASEIFALIQVHLATLHD